MTRPIDPPPLPVYPPPLPTFESVPPPLPRDDCQLVEWTAFPPPLPYVRPEEPPPLPLPPPRPKSDLELVRDFIEWIFGFVCVIGGLVFLASVPVLQFFSLGYLLEAGGTVARSGRLRDGFIGVRVAARLGGIIVAAWVFVAPLRILADVAHDAQIVDPGGKAHATSTFFLYLLTGIVFLHITLACARGGKLRYFLWPFNFIWVIVQIFRGGYYQRARDAVWDYTIALRLPHYFWLGIRGALVALAWLFIPVTMIALGHTKLATAGLGAFFGGVLLALVLLYLPFLQLRMAATNRLSEGFNFLAVRRQFRKAPWAFAFATIVTLLFALPLYLFKIEIVPEEAAWIPGLIFISFIYPARLLTGWAMGRAARRTEPRHWFFRWTGRLPLLPVAGFYALIVFFTQYTSWNGVWSLYEQHAFLVPVPFLGM